MGKRYIDAGAQCPYYCSEAPNKVYCEGLHKKQWVHMAWESDNEKKIHKRTFCRGDWKGCPIAKLPRD